MRSMRSFSWILLILASVAQGQVSYLPRPDLLEKVDQCLKHTYNLEFTEARAVQRELEISTPDHPAPFFLEALIVYWENFPLSPDDRASESFLRLMDKAIELAGPMIESGKLHLEGVFFDLYGRAFKAMFWADNGKSAKVVPDLRIMYKHVKEGFDLKEKFVEFYFSTGLYNYYIEAYPEAHPVYKPLLSFMSKGDKQEGLHQLNHAILHATFLKVEAMLFMSLIQLKYEEDLNSAAIYAERLHRDYPRNVFYQGHLATVLLYQHRYSKVAGLLESMEGQNDTYSVMIREMCDGFTTEHVFGNEPTAETHYKRLISLADSFDPFADQFKAIGYMGLSRIYAAKGLAGEARKYERKASGFTAYKIFLDK